MRFAQRLAQEFDIADARRRARATLSGGNQQKVIIAREFTREWRLLVAPNRRAAWTSVHRVHPPQADRARDSGMAVLLISAELEEVLEPGRSVAVMYRGRIVGVLDARTARHREEVGLLMATGGREGPPPQEAADVSDRPVDAPKRCVPSTRRRRRCPTSHERRSAVMPGDRPRCSSRRSPSSWP